MRVFFLPEFIADLQNHGDANFARRVLSKTMSADGNFRADKDDHRFQGIEKAWIRYVSRGNSAFRVIYIRSGDDIYFFRAGNHEIENTVARLSKYSADGAIQIAKSRSIPSDVSAAIGDASGDPNFPVMKQVRNRFKRNYPSQQLKQEIFSRRLLPHKDIWLVAPYINKELLLPTSQFGKILFDQAEDGAEVLIITSPPKDRKIEWMEKLEENHIRVLIYPHLHTKLYCFILNENRKYELRHPNLDSLESLILVGSANLTSAGLALTNGRYNEELCYVVPEEEQHFIETYVLELVSNGYDLPEVRRCLSRGQWTELENKKW